MTHSIPHYQLRLLLLPCSRRSRGAGGPPAPSSMLSPPTPRPTAPAHATANCPRPLPSFSLTPTARGGHTATTQLPLRDQQARARWARRGGYEVQTRGCHDGGDRTHHAALGGGRGCHRGGLPVVTPSDGRPGVATVWAPLPPWPCPPPFPLFGPMRRPQRTHTRSLSPSSCVHFRSPRRHSLSPAVTLQFLPPLYHPPLRPSPHKERQGGLPPC